MSRPCGSRRRRPVERGQDVHGPPAGRPRLDPDWAGSPSSAEEGSPSSTSGPGRSSTRGPAAGLRVRCPGARTVATWRRAVGPGEVPIWDTKTWKLLPRAVPDWAPALLRSIGARTRTRLVTVGDDGIDAGVADHGRRGSRRCGCPFPVRSRAWPSPPTGGSVAASSRHRALKIWDLGLRRRGGGEHRRLCSDVAFMPDRAPDRKVPTAARDRALDLDTGRVDRSKRSVERALGTGRHHRARPEPGREVDRRPLRRGASAPGGDRTRRGVRAKDVRGLRTGISCGRLEPRTADTGGQRPRTGTHDRRSVR